jgi:hypothetical protein
VPQHENSYSQRATSQPPQKSLPNYQTPDPSLTQGSFQNSNYPAVIQSIESTAVTDTISKNALVGPADSSDIHHVNGTVEERKSSTQHKLEEDNQRTRMSFLLN